MNLKKFLYIIRIEEVNEAQKFRFKTAFLVAIYIMIMLPIVKKYQGVFFTTQLITILIILQQFSNKLLEIVNEYFIIGRVFHLLIILEGIELGILFLYFYDFKLMIYIYSFFDILIGFIATLFSIKLTNLQAKIDPTGIKKIQIFKQNIWAEGFFIGLIISLFLQNFNITIIIISAILIRIFIFVYMLMNWNFFDIFFKKYKL